MKLPRARNLILTIAAVVALLAVGLLIAQDHATQQIRTSLSADHPAFPEYLARLVGHPLTSGERYIVHADEAAFPAMLDAIGRAQYRISFEGYIYDAGEIGDQFTSAFEAAANRGVEVRLVLDALGAAVDPDHIERLERAGCQIGWFNPIAGIAVKRLTFRTHRKALVIDGDIAFIGGTGIGDQWAKETDAGPPWRDTMVEIRGPAAVHVEAAFHENWIETGGIVEPDLLRHPTYPDASTQSIVVWSSPEGGTNSMKLLYLLAIAAARQTLDIQSPYLITDDSVDWSLSEARKRRVRVRMLVEGEITDAKPVKFASRAKYAWFLEQGIEVYEYQPAMMHAKALIVDGILSIVGSANFDNRSLELNDELNVAVFDRGLARRLVTDFERDLAQSQKLELEQWRSRPLHIRGREKLWSVFGEVF